MHRHGFFMQLLLCAVLGLAVVYFAAGIDSSELSLLGKRDLAAPSSQKVPQSSSSADSPAGPVSDTSPQPLPEPKSAQSSPEAPTTPNVTGVPPQVAHVVREQAAQLEGAATEIANLVRHGGSPANLTEAQWNDVALMLREYPTAVVQMLYLSDLTGRRANVLLGQKEEFFRNASEMSEKTRATWVALNQGRPTKYPLWTGAAIYPDAVAIMMAQHIEKMRLAVMTPELPTVSDVSMLLDIGSWLQSKERSLRGMNEHIDELAATFAPARGPTQGRPQARNEPEAPLPTDQIERAIELQRRREDATAAALQEQQETYRKQRAGLADATPKDLSAAALAVGASLDDYFEQTDKRIADLAASTGSPPLPTPGRVPHGTSASYPIYFVPTAWTIADVLAQAEKSRYPNPSPAILDPEVSSPRTIRVTSEEWEEAKRAARGEGPVTPPSRATQAFVNREAANHSDPNHLDPLFVLPEGYAQSLQVLVPSGSKPTWTVYTKDLPDHRLETNWCAHAYARITQLAKESGIDLDKEPIRVVLMIGGPNKEVILIASDETVGKTLIRVPNVKDPISLPQTITLTRGGFSDWTTTASGIIQRCYREIESRRK